MKAVVVLHIHDREENLSKWLGIWGKCKTSGHELVVIHTAPNAESAERFKSISEEHGVKYIKRKNQGFDIGSFQDICKKRLAGFSSEYDYLIWHPDDIFPVSEDFIDKYLDPFKFPNVGISCYEISTEVRPHVRTVGFCIKHALLDKLVFPADPIMTKDQCYVFEHRGPNSLYDQVTKTGNSVVQIAPLESSPMWDMDHRRYLNRDSEMSSKWGFPMPTNKVIVICPTFEESDKYPIICASMLSQTYQEWELYLVHNGPLNKSYAGHYKDPRIHVIESLPAKGTWGHPIRKEYIEKVSSGEIQGDYVLITNGDNYYMPVFLERMVAGIKSGSDTVAVYCDLIHNGHKYEVLKAQLKYTMIDCGAVMIRKDFVSVGWNDMSHSSDWTFFDAIIKRHGAHRWKKIPGVLFVHN